MNRQIRNSAKALIIKDGKMLAIRLRDEDGEFYLMPGGGQNSEELLHETVKREVAEEIGILVEPKELVFAIECLNEESYHRVDLVFLCKYIKNIDNNELHEDKNQIGFEWLPIIRLKEIPLYPKKLRTQIMQLYKNKKYDVYLGNEDKEE